MFSRFVALLSLAALTSTVADVIDFTYKPTSSSCQGTVSSPCGPEQWYKSSSDCNATSFPHQSPINFVSTNVVMDNEVPMPTPLASKGCATWEQLPYPDSTYSVLFTNCKKLAVTYLGNKYFLDYVQFRSPSEHTFGGGYYPAEAQLVHYSNVEGTSDLVIAVPLTVPVSGTANNQFLDTLWEQGLGELSRIATNIPVVNSSVALNPYDAFLPGKPGVYVYDGSLTIPNCTSAKWFVFAEPVLISHNDLGFLRDSVALLPNNLLTTNGDNNRPTQALAGRVVRYSTGYVSTPTPSPTYSNDMGYTAAAAGGVALAVAILSAFLLSAVAYKVLHRPETTSA